MRYPDEHTRQLARETASHIPSMRRNAHAFFMAATELNGGWYSTFDQLVWRVNAKRHDSGDPRGDIPLSAALKAIKQLTAAGVMVGEYVPSRGGYFYRLPCEAKYINRAVTDMVRDGSWTRLLDSVLA